MDIIQAIFDNTVKPIINALFDFLIGLINTFFFWLPDNPFSETLAKLQTTIQANVTAIKWLNWFVNVPLFATAFGAVVAAMSIWIVYILMYKAWRWVLSIKQIINLGG